MTTKQTFSVEMVGVLAPIFAGAVEVERFGIGVTPAMARHEQMF
jgi:hypothetical protein